MAALTPHHLEAVRALVTEGDGKAAAHALGISDDRLRHRLAAVHRALGVETTVQAVYVLTARGELVVPGRE